MRPDGSGGHRASPISRGSDATADERDTQAGDGHQPGGLLHASGVGARAGMHPARIGADGYDRNR